MGKGVTVVLVRVASYLARKSTEKHRVHNLLKEIDSTGASFPQAGGTLKVSRSSIPPSYSFPLPQDKTNPPEERLSSSPKRN